MIPYVLIKSREVANNLWIYHCFRVRFVVEDVNEWNRPSMSISGVEQS